MTGPIIGIDIGSHGAIALLTPAGDLLEERTPVGGLREPSGVSASYPTERGILRDGPKGRPSAAAGGEAANGATPFRMSPAIAISAASARPSSLTRANVAAWPGQRRIAFRAVLDAGRSS
jgi:hypothetical protein